MGIFEFLDKTINDISIGSDYPREKRNFSNTEILAIENFYSDFNKEFNNLFELINSKREIIENYNVVSRRYWSGFNYHISEQGQGIASREIATESFIKSFYYQNKLIQFSFTKKWLNKLNNSTYPRYSYYFRDDEKTKFIKRIDMLDYEFSKNHQPEYFTGIDYEARIGDKNLEKDIQIQNSLPSGFYQADYKRLLVSIPTRYIDDYNTWDSITNNDFKKQIIDVSIKALKKEVDDLNSSNDEWDNKPKIKEQENKVKINCKNIDCNTILNVKNDSDGIIKCPKCGIRFYERT